MNPFKPVLTMPKKLPSFLLPGVIFLLPLLAQGIYAEITGFEQQTRIVWLFLTWILSWFVRYRWLLGIVVLPFFIGGLTDIAYAVVFHAVFTSAAFEAIEQTNVGELTEFVNAYANMEVLLWLAGYIAMAAITLQACRLPAMPASKPGKITGITFALLFAAIVVFRLAVDHKYFGTFPGALASFPSYLNNAESLDQEIAERKTLLPRAQDQGITFANAIPDKQTYVFFIGESANRNHMQIYGYPRASTPRLNARNDLLVLDNVISSHAQTLPSLRNVLTQAATDNDIPYNQAISIVEAAKAAGFTTWWISNQQPLRGTYSAIAAQATHNHYISNDFHGAEIGRFDGFVLPQLQQALQDKAARKVIFIHIMGSHLQYKSRYPREFAHYNDPAPQAFKSDEELSSKQRNRINEYDNTMLYADYLLDTSISLLQASVQANDIAGFSYIADHGEEVFDTMDFSGHGPDNFTKHMFDVPFICWFSAGFIRQFPDKVQQLQLHRDTAFMLDDYYHFTLDMMAIDSATFIASKSPMRNDFLHKRRLVYGVDYDRHFQPHNQLSSLAR
jgi:heptose-I-phosphate ethanolaminephosphotransferase